MLTFKLPNNQDYHSLDALTGFNGGASLIVTETSTFDIPTPFLPRNQSSNFRKFDGARYVSATTIFEGGTITVTDTDDYRDYVEMITSGATSQRVLSDRVYKIFGDRFIGGNGKQPETNPVDIPDVYIPKELIISLIMQSTGGNVESNSVMSFKEEF